MSLLLAWGQLPPSIVPTAVVKQSLKTADNTSGKDERFVANEKARAMTWLGCPFSFHTRANTKNAAPMCGSAAKEVLHKAHAFRHEHSMGKSHPRHFGGFGTAGRNWDSTLP